MLAECCVFSKQSQPPGHCGPFRLQPRGPSPTAGAPSPEVTVLVCRVPSPEFSPAPEDSLLAHLCRFAVRALICSLSAFLASVNSTSFLLMFVAHTPTPVDTRTSLRIGLGVLMGTTIAPLVYPPVSLLRITLLSGAGISTCCPSPTTTVLGLGPDLP